MIMAVMFVLGTILVISVAVAVGLFLPKRKGVDGVNVNGFFKNQEWKWARVLGSVIALYAVIWLIPTSHWWVRWVWVDHNWWLVLIAHLLLTWAYLILPDNPKKPVDRRFAWWVAKAGMVLLLITFGFPEYVGNPLMDGKVIEVTRKGYLPRFKWVDDPNANSGGDNNNAGGSNVRLPISPSPFPLNEEAWREDLGFWMGHVATKELTQDEAEMMAAHCVIESAGCNQFEADGTTPMRNKDGSSAVCKYQIMLSAHAEILKKFQDAGNGDYVDVRTADGCRNFAYELVMSNKARGIKFNRDWDTTENDAKKFLGWVHSLPPDSGDPSLRNPNAPLVARGGRGPLPTLQTPKGWKPGDPIPDNPTGIQPQAEASASNSNTQPVSPAAEPKGNDCKEIRIETSLDEVSDFYKIGHHAHIRTEPKGAYWMVFYNRVMISSHPNDQQSYYPLNEGKESVAFQSYKLSPEGDTATIYLTPCSNDE